MFIHLFTVTEQYSDNISEFAKYSNTSFIFYNRMAKCASSTTLQLFQLISKHNGWNSPPLNNQMMKIIQKGRNDLPWLYYIDSETGVSNLK